MGYEATGTLRTVGPTVQVSERFSKREFVVEIADNPKYPQLVQFQLTGDRCSQLDGLNDGDEVQVEFSLRGRRWDSPKGETKYFNTLDAWKVTPKGERANAPRNQGSREVTAGGQYGAGASADSDNPDDLPF